MAAVRGMDTPGFSMRDDPAAGPSRQIMQDRQGSAKFAGIGGRVANLPGRLALVGRNGPSAPVGTLLRRRRALRILPRGEDRR